MGESYGRDRKGLQKYVKLIIIHDWENGKGYMIKFKPQYNQEQGLKDYFKWYNNKYGTDLQIH